MSFSVTPRGGALTARGGWNVSTVYYQDDIVIYGGLEYQSLLPVNIGNQPNTSTFAWAELPSGGTAPLGGFNVMTYGGATGGGIVDDTVAVQNTCNAASAAASASGIVDVIFPSGYKFLLSQVVVPSNIRIWAYGADLIPNPVGIVQAMFRTGVSLNRFEIAGGNFIGAGTENFAIFATTHPSVVTDSVFRDMYVNGWGTQPLFIGSPTRCKVLFNVMINLGNVTDTNYVNFVFSGDNPTEPTEIIAVGNIIEGNINGGALAIVGNLTSPQPLKSVFSHNILMASGHDAGVVDLESGAGANPQSRMVVAHNHISAAGPSLNGNGVVVKAGMADVIVNNNTIDCTAPSGGGNGVYFVTTPTGAVIVEHNRIRVNAGSTPIAGTLPNSYRGRGNTLGLSGTGGAQGRAVLVAGTVTVSTDEIRNNDNVLFSVVVPGGTRGEVQLGTITNLTSFVINSIQPGTASTIQTLDTSTVFWEIVH